MKSKNKEIKDDGWSVPDVEWSVPDVEWPCVMDGEKEEQSSIEQRMNNGKCMESAKKKRCKKVGKLGRSTGKMPSKEELR